MNLTDRALHILNSLVSKYIRDGAPVGSRVLAEQAEVPLSPASIRNIMADLEKAGLLQSPHTSAGRVPTVKGYRVFVNHLLRVQDLETNPFASINLPNHSNPKSMVSAASDLLAKLTQLTGIVSMPKSDEMILRQVDFLSLSKRRVLVILVLNNAEVQNRVINTERAYSESELIQAANFMNQHYIGKDLGKIREALISDMVEDQEAIQQMMQQVINIAHEQASESQHDDYVIAGEKHLLGMATQTNIDRLQSLFSAFSEKRDMLHLLDQSLRAKGIHIYIGDESGYDVFDDCSVVTAPYGSGNKVLGALGVIGPKRMAYDKAISAVDVTAKLLTAALSQTDEDET